MYPLRKTTLELEDVARHWQRHIPGPPPRGEVLDILVQAFWRGELTLRELPGFRSLDRQDALAVMWALTALSRTGIWKDGPDDKSIKLVFTALGEWDAETAWPLTLRLHRIDLPREREKWTPPLVFVALSNISHDQFDDYPMYCAAWMLGFWVRRDDFAAFCALRGYDAPAWWGEPEVPGRQGKSTRPLRGAARGHDHREQAITAVAARYRQRGAPRTKKEIGNDLIRELARLGPLNAEPPTRTTLDRWADQVIQRLK